MAYFRRPSRNGKSTQKPNPRLKNCFKTSQAASAQSELSSSQYCTSQRLQSEKSQMRIFPNYGDFILIPIYIGSYVKIQFSCQNSDLPFFWRKTCDDQTTPHKTTSLTSLSWLCWYPSTSFILALHYWYLVSHTRAQYYPYLPVNVPVWHNVPLSCPRFNNSLHRASFAVIPFNLHDSWQKYTRSVSITTHNIIAIAWSSLPLLSHH